MYLYLFRNDDNECISKMQKKVSELKRILYPSSHSDVRQKETLLDLKRTKGLQFFLEQTAFGPINACNGCNLCNPNIQETEHYFVK